MNMSGEYENRANAKKKQIIVILEGACLETVKSKKVNCKYIVIIVGICSPQC